MRNIIKPNYIEFMCAAYALDKALKALMNSGVINIGITQDENGVLWVRYKNMNYEADNLLNRSPSEFEGYKYPACGVEE